MSSKSNKKVHPIKGFLNSAFEEYGKITWPTKHQAVLLTGLSIGVSAVVVLLIGVLDLGFSELYSLLLNNL